MIFAYLLLVVVSMTVSFILLSYNKSLVYLCFTDKSVTVYCHCYHITIKFMGGIKDNHEKLGTIYWCQRRCKALI